MARLRHEKTRSARPTGHGTIEVLVCASRSAFARGACLFFRLEDGLDAAAHQLDVVASAGGRIPRCAFQASRLREQQSAPHGNAVLGRAVAVASPPLRQRLSHLTLR